MNRACEGISTPDCFKQARAPATETRWAVTRQYNPVLEFQRSPVYSGLPASGSRRHLNWRSRAPLYRCLRCALQYEAIMSIDEPATRHAWALFIAVFFLVLVAQLTLVSV